jgi:H+/gluconate symporter-like permease
MSIVCSVVVLVFSLLYIKWQLKLSAAAGEIYEIGGAEANVDVKPEELPPLGLAMTPMILLISVIFIGSTMRIPDIIIPALAISVISASILLKNHLPNQIATLNAGAINAVAPVFLTAAAVGVGSVTAAAPGFKLILNALSGLPGGPLTQLTAITGLMSVVTASPSGALGIVIPAFGKAWLASGLSPEVIHRVSAISAGAFGAMPHCGLVFAMMAVAGLRHKDVFRHFFFIGFIGGIIALIVAIMMSVLY